MNKNDASLKKLVKFILLNNSKSDLKASLDALLTPKEIEEFVTRLEIVKLLKKDLPQHQIAKKLSVGVATVTRGSKELKKGKFDTVKLS